ncbi:hypothetical protein BH23CHL8_BH23CHL8_16030 [soil metagenome]
MAGSTPLARTRPTGPGRLRALPDDRLGELVMAVIVSELRWVPDIAPAVMDRLTRDAVAYPEHLARTPDQALAPGSGKGQERRSRRVGRRAIVAMLAAAALLAAAAIVLLGPQAVQGSTAEPEALVLDLQPVAQGFDQPLLVSGDGSGSGRLYVVEQTGRIRVVEADGRIAGEPFLDLSDKLSVAYEQGLLGLAFHPDHATNGRFFVNYTRREDGATVVSELLVRDGRADRDSERELLVIDQPFANHNGGMIAFDAEGYLLVGMGDGGGGGDPQNAGQDPASLLGKLLRLDVDGATPYAIPPDNGFGGDDAYRPEIHASGLRNPWRFSVDPEGGHITIGDVGQDSWEEISVLPEGRGGVSLGWNEMEGPECFHDGCRPEAHVAPVMAYGRDQGCTVIGGHVYRGTAQPDLEGIYLFGDYCSGTIWAASAARMLEGPTEAAPVATLDGTLVAFGRDDAGELYAVDQGGRILHVAARQAHEADATAAGGSWALLAAAEDASPVPDAADASPSTSPGFHPDAVALRLVPVVTGLLTPVSVARDGTGSGLLYVVERAGSIKVLAADGIRADPLLDITELVGTGGELGLHDVAFHPRFARNGRFFVHYNDLQGDSRVDEFRVQRGRLPVDPASRKRIFEVEQPFINNNGGWLAFGPDGYLYVALGDGGGPSPGDPSGYGQRRDTVLGKILRLDVDRGRRYAIPRDNPFTSRRQRRVFAPETWVWGLREPRRASFDRVTGDLWIGDVGQDRYEEIDLVPAGQSGLNFGWSDMEGDRCHLVADCDAGDYVSPVHVYDQAPPHCGVVGGHVYRGEAIPALVGAYLFSDLCSGVIWALDAEAVRRGEEAPVAALLDAPQGFWAFGEDDLGELYLTSLDGGVYRIEAEDTR